jgi:hypothetical protein
MQELQPCRGGDFPNAALARSALFALGQRLNERGALVMVAPNEVAHIVASRGVTAVFHSLVQPLFHFIRERHTHRGHWQQSPARHSI